MSTEMKFTTRRQFNGIKIFDANGAAITTFDATSNAFEVFKTGLAHTPGASLYDEDRGEYLIGTVDQLVSSQPIESATPAAKNMEEILLAVQASDWRIADGGDDVDLADLQKLPWTLQVKHGGYDGLYIEGLAPDGTVRTIGIEVSKGNLQATIGSSASDDAYAIVQIGLNAVGVEPMVTGGPTLRGVRIDHDGMRQHDGDIEEGCTAEAAAPSM